MAVSVTGPRAVNELGGPVIPGTSGHARCEKENIIFESSNIHLNTNSSVFYFYFFIEKNTGCSESCV